MIFRLSTSKNIYTDKQEMAEFEELGFAFKSFGKNGFMISGTPTIDIKTLENLIGFTKKWGQIILVPSGLTGHEIEIYNDDRE